MSLQWNRNCLDSAWISKHINVGLLPLGKHCSWSPANILSETLEFIQPFILRREAQKACIGSDNSNR